MRPPIEFVRVMFGDIAFYHILKLIGVCQLQDAHTYMYGVIIKVWDIRFLKEILLCYVGLVLISIFDEEYVILKDLR